MTPAPLTVPEVAARLRCSRSRVFELLADGTLTRAPRYGRHTTVTAASVERALTSTTTATPGPARGSYSSSAILSIPIGR